MLKKNLTGQHSKNEHFFFGYYDLQPYSQDNQKHLAHRVYFMDRNPIVGDVAEIGYIKINNNHFVKVAETSAWNFQQGAFLQWYEDGETVVFNDFDGEKYISRVVNINGREVKRFDKPFASMSMDSGYALSINFSRIFDFRKGYGYCNIPDKNKDIRAPQDDGIFLVDLKTGKDKQLISYSRMKDIFEEKPFTDEKLVVNHITFNPSGTKFIFLLRNFSEGGKKWGTVLAVSDLQGNVKKLTDFEVNSHYSWKDDEELMIYSGLPEWGVYFINVNSGVRIRLNDELCDKDDIHCNYAPDRKSFIGDGYPVNNMRSVYHYDFTKRKSCELFKVFSVPVTDIDIRCDLHVRWSADGTRISYDTTENGCREIMQIIL